MNPGLEKAISGLKMTVEQHKRHDLVKISNDQIEVRVNGKQFWGTILYVSLVILTPLSLLVYYLFFNKDNSEVFWLSVFVVVFAYELYRILRGDNVLVINLKEGYFEVQNINAVFTKLFKKRKVMFSALTKVAMEEKSVYSKYRRIKWYELAVYDKQSNRTILSSFDEKAPLPKIGNRVKLVVDLILKEQRKYLKSSSS